MTGKTQMPTLQRFERVILAWALILVIAAGPLSADQLKKKTTGFGFVGVPQGTKTVTLTWSVTAAVLPDREWNCGNGQGGFIDMFSYTPDEWTVDMMDANSGTPVAHEGGTTPPLLFSCPGSDAPHPTPLTSSVQVDVSAYTVDGDATFRVGTDDSGEDRTTTPGPPSPHFNCDPLGQPFTIGAIITADSSPPQFIFKLDPSKGIGAPNPWNTPDDARVLTHKYGTGDGYPSQYQIERNDVTLRPRFRFPGTAKANGSGAALKVWFRAVDPPDTAPYVVLATDAQGHPASDAHDNDNKDTFSGGKGILMNLPCSDFSAQSTCAALNGGVLATTTASDGTIEVVLETTDRYAGDNYQILASFSAPGADGKFPCEEATPNTCDKSAQITTWKRIYMEQHSMFRRGSFLAKDAPTGESEIFVTDIKKFHSGDHVAFVHSDGGGTQPLSESHFIDVVPAQDGVATHLHLRDGDLVNTFFRNSDLGATFLGDAVGVSNAGGSTDDVYVAYLGPLAVNGTRPVDELFATMFVDVQFTPGDLPFVPLFDGMAESRTRTSPDTPSEASKFAEHWFQNLPQAGANHRILIGAARSDADDHIGVTVDHADLHASYSFRGRIEDLVHKNGSDLLNLDPDIVSFENVAHELLHQWRVNLGPVPQGGDGVGHCAENAFDNPKMFCRMHGSWSDVTHNGERGDGIIKLHYVKRNTLVDSEYVTIRQAAEPMP